MLPSNVVSMRSGYSPTATRRMISQSRAMPSVTRMMSVQSLSNGNGSVPLSASPIPSSSPLLPEDQVAREETAPPVKYTAAKIPSDAEGSDSDDGLELSKADEVIEAELLDSIGATTLEMPENSYGAAMALCVQAAAAGANGDWLIWTKAIGTLLSCMLGIIAEGFILVTVKHYLTRPAVVAVRALYAEYEREYRNETTGMINVDAFRQDQELQEQICQLPLANRWFCFVILAVWTGCILAELKEAMWLSYAWWHIGTPDKDHAFTRWDDDEKKFIIQRVSKPMKALVFVTILIPKFIIACFCWWFGCRWLVATPHYQDFILNSVALAFVLDISTLIYTVIIPRDSKMWISFHCLELPPEGVQGKSIAKQKRMRVLKALIRMAFSWAFTLLIPAMYMVVQQAIPGYRWDVADACQAYFAAMRSYN